MDEKLWTPILVALAWLAFAAVSLVVATGLGPRRLVLTKLRLGALLIGLSTVAITGCGEGEEMCYAAPYEPDDTGDTGGPGDTGDSSTEKDGAARS